MQAPREATPFTAVTSGQVAVAIRVNERVWTLSPKWSVVDVPSLPRIKATRVPRSVRL